MVCSVDQALNTCALFAGAIFGPVITKWLQFLERLKFASPTRAVAYRVRAAEAHPTSHVC